MATTRIFEALSAFNEFIVLRKADFQWITSTPHERYLYARDLIKSSHTEEDVIQLRYFLEQELDPNWIPDDTPSERRHYRYLLFNAMSLTCTKPMKTKMLLMLFNFGARIDLFINQNDHPNMMTILWPCAHAPAYAKLYITYGLYLPSLEEYSGRGKEETLRIAQEEPDFVNAYNYTTSAENALKEDPPNHKDAIENFELAKACFERIAQSEEKLAEEFETDQQREIYGYDALLIDHYRQRALDCQEAIADCEASQRDSNDSTATHSTEENEPFLAPNL